MTSFALNARGAGLILAACVITTFPSHTLAQRTNPLIGSWITNIPKSTYSSGRTPKSPATRTFTQNADGLTFALTGGRDPDGNALTPTRWAAHFDGKDYPMVGSSTTDMVTIAMINASNLEVLSKKGGRVTDTSRYTVSQDGKTISWVATGTNAAGLPIRNVVILDKQ